MTWSNSKALWGKLFTLGNVISRDSPRASSKLREFELQHKKLWNKQMFISSYVSFSVKGQFLETKDLDTVSTVDDFSRVVQREVARVQRERPFFQTKPTDVIGDLGKFEKHHLGNP